MKESMPNIEKITSTKNPKIKNFTSLLKSRERKLQGLFVVEGIREVERAINAGYFVDHLFYCKELINEKQLSVIIDHTLPGCKMYEISPDVYNHIAYRKDAEGIIGWMKNKETSLRDIELKENPFILVLESVEKPGNLGAILRTADAAGVDAIIVCNPQTDIYNPNVIRSSLGGIFSNMVVTAASLEVIQWLKNHKINMYCTSLNASKSYLEVDFEGPSAIVMGTEATGLSDQWLAASSQNIIIPMKGKVDSMNVSVSTGIVLFEVLRQRNKNI